MWSTWCENISCWSWLWKLKDLQYVSHYPRLNAVWFGFSRLVEEECDMILNGGYSCRASMAARFRRLENGFSKRKQCILRSVRDAFLTLRHAYPSLPPQCRRQRALVTSQLPCSLLLSCLARSSWWLCEVIPLYGYKTGALEGACDYHSQSQDAPRTPQVVFQVPYLSRVCSFLLSSAGKGRMGAPDEQTTNVCWYQGSKYILVSLKLGKEKLVTSWQGPVP